ncbi:MAG: cytochrome b/b6 domain-containing protein [Nitrospirae bacterium]|nr:cytochrome b/b6 domain-containing protein [Nitrospirota bacterium]MCL5237586.1 cytochrome b/b6 domain-containing protein [Nitrospirota bacterium]
MSDNNKIRRFSAFRIAEHWVFMITFSILVITGLSQKFYSLDLSMWLIFHLGGIDYVRLIHRYTGIIFLIATSMHVITGIIGIAFRRWQPSMVINKKDFSDAVHNIKYYLGMEDHPAICDRYGYRQKFEYWGVLIGSIIMVFSGLILWFPVSVTRFLPGEIIPAAKVLHTNQALLIFAVIALWHIYNSIFSPEIFPLDKGIFTGTISRERMALEHPVELARIENKPVEEILSAHRETERHENSEVN